MKLSLLLQNQKLISILKILLFCILIYFPLFLCLDFLPIRMWDEGRYSINSYEMYLSGNLLSTTYDGALDMWNTKPQLMLWLQTLCYHIFGVSELSVRLPSAISGVVLCSCILFFSVKYLKNYWYGIVAVLVLLTSTGYVKEHVSLTGDFDALLTLFTTLYCICWFIYLKSKKLRYLHLFFTFLVLAFLTKSSQSLLFIPALFIYFVFQKNVFAFLKNKWLYIDLFISISILALYYFIREQNAPGYLSAVYENEFGGRYSKSIEGHTGPFNYYYDIIINADFYNWILFFIGGIFVGLFTKKKRLRSIIVYSLLLSITYLLFISMAETKLHWYTAPAFPFLSIIAAASIIELLNLFRNYAFFKSSFHFNFAPLLFFIYVFFVPYKTITAIVSLKSERGNSDNFDYKISYLLRNNPAAKRLFNNNFICYDGHNGHLAFYTNLLIKKGVNTGFKDFHKLKPNDTVTAYQNEVRNYIESTYITKVIKQDYHISTYAILSDSLTLKELKIICDDLEDSTKYSSLPQVAGITPLSGKYIHNMGANTEFGYCNYFNVSTFPKNTRVVDVSLNLFKMDNSDKKLVLVCSVTNTKGESSFYEEYNIENKSLPIMNSWNRVSVPFKMGLNRFSLTDEFRIFLYNRDKKDFYLDDFEIIFKGM